MCECDDEVDLGLPKNVPEPGVEGGHERFGQLSNIYCRCSSCVCPCSRFFKRVEIGEEVCTLSRANKFKHE